MKCVQIDKSFKPDVEETPVEMFEHTIAGIVEDKDKKTASIFNILTSEDDDDSMPIVIKTSYQYDTDEDAEYVSESPVLIDNMEEELKNRVYKMINPIPRENIWYTDLIPTAWNEENEDEIVGISCWRVVNDQYHHMVIKMPFGTYAFLAKIKSDMITHIPMNVHYTYTDDRVYPSAMIKSIDFKGFEPAGKAEDGSTKLVNMYDCVDSNDVKFGLLVPVQVEDAIDNDAVSDQKNQINIDDFVKERPIIVNFDVTSFFYFERLKNDKIVLVPAIISYEPQNDSWMIYKLSEPVLKEVFGGYKRFVAKSASEETDETGSDS